jgi:integrase
VAKLTDAAVHKYKPTKQRRIIRDEGAESLFLVIQSSGHKAWLMRFRGPNGKPQKMVLGPVFSGKETPGKPVIGEPLTLAGARLMAAQIQRERKQGQDPVAEHKARKHRARVEIEDRNANSFAAAATRFIEEHAKRNTRRWHETTRLLGFEYDGRLLKGGLAERWATKPVRSVDGHIVWAEIDTARHIAPGRARALFAALSSMFGWLQRHRLVELNPCAGVHRPPAPAARERTLSTDEIRRFWTACDHLALPFGPLFKLLLLLGARLREVGEMRWDELRDDGTWLIPSSRTKNRRQHLVPLSPLAHNIFASVSRIEGCPFPFSTTGKSPVSGWSKTKRRLDALMSATEPWRIHDLRRTCITGMAELGVAPHVIELVVNHISGHRAGVAGVYNRSELLPERRAALERWSQHVQGIVSGESANVVQLSLQRRQ